MKTYKILPENSDEEHFHASSLAQTACVTIL